MDESRLVEVAGSGYIAREHRSVDETGLSALALKWSVPDDLAALTHAELIDQTESAIYAGAILSSRGVFSEDNQARLTALSNECHRRTPNGRLYTIAYNRASAGVCTPDPVPPDERER